MVSDQWAQSGVGALPSGRTTTARPRARITSRSPAARPRTAGSQRSETRSTRLTTGSTRSRGRCFRTGWCRGSSTRARVLSRRTRGSSSQQARWVQASRARSNGCPSAASSRWTTSCRSTRTRSRRPCPSGRGTSRATGSPPATTRTTSRATSSRSLRRRRCWLASTAGWTARCATARGTSRCCARSSSATRATASPSCTSRPRRRSSSRGCGQPKPEH